MCDVLANYLEDQYKNFTWVVITTDSSDGAYHSYNEDVYRCTFFDEAEKDVVIFGLQGPTYDRNALIETEAFKSQIRNTFLQVSKGHDGTVEELVLKAEKVFPAIKNYQTYVLQTEKEVFVRSRDVSLFHEFIRNYYVIVVKGSSSFDIAEVTQRVENLKLPSEAFSVQQSLQENKMYTGPPCTIITEPDKEQHFYHCKTCNIVTEDKAICRHCAKACHKQHELAYFKSTKLICFCGRKNGDKSVAKCVAVPNDPCTFITDQGRFKEQHWFRCKTCNMGANKGACLFCVKLCHREHEMIYAKFGTFHCDCGLNSTLACQFYPSNVTCKAVTDNGEYREQAWFRCKTCKMKEHFGLCYVCVKACHNQHEMGSAKFSFFVCDCEKLSVFSCKACPPKEWCSFVANRGEMTEQSWYRCNTCSMEEGIAICKICTKVCHPRHDIVEVGSYSSICDCGSSTGGDCKASSRAAPESSSESLSQSEPEAHASNVVVQPIPKAIQQKFNQFSWDCLAAHNAYRARHGSPPLVLAKWVSYNNY